MTKTELRRHLGRGACLDELFYFTSSHGSTIFKSTFSAPNHIIYIPDLYQNEIPSNVPFITEDSIDDVLALCFTGRDLIRLCSDDEELAMRLFVYCDHQHPDDALAELEGDDEDPLEATLPDDLKKAVIIKVFSPEEASAVAEKLRTQLAGNQDFIQSRIVLSRSEDRDDGSENEVRLYVYNDAETDPEITI